MRLLPAGRTAVLVELDDAGQRRRLHRTLSEHPAVGTVDLVPAQTTVLIDVESPGELLFRERVGEVWLASPVQVYLDLVRGEGRSKELAEHLRRERIGF